MANTAPQPTICLNMIVKNEAHIVHEAIDSVAPHIHYWVIVDTGSTDGTQDIIRTKMAELGIPGEIHERPWRDFGHNRTEALQLAQGHCDYIWVHDADDVLEGNPQFKGLTAGAYSVLKDSGIHQFWVLHLFQDGLPWRYEGSTHEFPVCHEPHTEERLRGDYRIRYRELGSNSISSHKFERDRELLLAEIADNPCNSRAVFYLALTYRAMGDYKNAREWWAKRAEMGGFEEEVYYAKLKLAEAMDRLGEYWSDAQAAYLSAFAFRPTRAEALYEVAFHYRCAKEYELGYLFAARGAQIPLPESDVLFVHSDTYTWRLLDEQSVCASWIGRKMEALTIDRLLLTREDLPDAERERICSNRDQNAAELLETSAIYSGDLVRRPPPQRDAEVTVTLTAGAIRSAAENTLNSFLRCCTDVGRVGRVLIIDTGLTAPEGKTLARKYPFLDFICVPDADLNIVREQVGGRYWLHLWHGWRFFTEEALITRLIDVLETKPDVYQVGVNLGDAMHLGPNSPARDGVLTTPRGNRYLLSTAPPTGPSMFDMTRLNRALENASGDGPLQGTTATLDEVLCIHDS